MGARLFNLPPAARYVHPMVAKRAPGAGDHDYGIDVANDNATRYLHWVADLVTPYLGESVLEVGAGIGSITQHLAPGREIVAADISDFCIDALRARFGAADNVQVVQADLRTWDPGRSFDSIVMINVLEHIEADADALRSLSRHLRPGGTMVLYVPALNGLFGKWDLKVGHFRRYSRWRLRHVFEEAGLEPQELRYSNLLAIPAWALFTRFSPADAATADRTLPAWDRYAVPLSRFIESRVRIPLGLNLLGVARRDEYSPAR